MDPDTHDRLAANMPVPLQQLQKDAADAATDARVAQKEREKAAAERAEADRERIRQAAA